MTQAKSTITRNDRYVDQMSTAHKIMLDASRCAAEKALERTKKTMELSMNQTAWVFQRWQDAIDMWGSLCQESTKAAAQMAEDQIEQTGKILNGEDNVCSIEGVSRIPCFVFPKAS